MGQTPVGSVQEGCALEVRREQYPKVQFQSVITGWLVGAGNRGKERVSRRKEWTGRRKGEVLVAQQ